MIEKQTTHGGQKRLPQAQDAEVDERLYHSRFEKLEQAMRRLGWPTNSVVWRVCRLVHLVAGTGDGVLRWQASRIASDRAVACSYSSVRKAIDCAISSGLVTFQLGKKRNEPGRPYKMLAIDWTAVYSLADDHDFEGDWVTFETADQTADQTADFSRAYKEPIEPTIPIEPTTTTSDPDPGGGCGDRNFDLVSARKKAKRFRELARLPPSSLPTDLVWKAAWLDVHSAWNCLEVARFIGEGRAVMPSRFLAGAIARAEQEACHSLNADCLSQAVKRENELE